MENCFTAKHLTDTNYSCLLDIVMLLNSHIQRYIFPDLEQVLKILDLLGSRGPGGKQWSEREIGSVFSACGH